MHDEVTREDAALALKLADRMGQVLRKRHPAVMGGALAEVVSKWLAGHHPDMREQVLKDFLEATHKLVAINHKILMKHYGDVWPRREEDEEDEEDVEGRP